MIDFAGAYRLGFFRSSGLIFLTSFVKARLALGFVIGCDCMVVIYQKSTNDYCTLPETNTASKNRPGCEISNQQSSGAFAVGSRDRVSFGVAVAVIDASTLRCSLLTKRRHSTVVPHRFKHHCFGAPTVATRGCRLGANLSEQERLGCFILRLNRIAPIAEMSLKTGCVSLVEIFERLIANRFVG